MDTKYLDWVARQIIRTIPAHQLIDWLRFLRNRGQEMRSRVLVDITNLVPLASKEIDIIHINGTQEEVDYVITNITSSFTVEWAQVKAEKSLG